MNKIFLSMAVGAIVLAGCSSTAAAAHTENKNINTATVYPVVSFEKKISEMSNQTKMRKIVVYLKSRTHRTPYVFSGDTPRGWDCSGLVRWVYERFGFTLPHSADKQAHIGNRVHQPKIGDIVVFARHGRTNFYHAAIYIGNNEIVNANTMYGTTVIQPLEDYRGDEIRFVEIVKQPSTVKPAIAYNSVCWNKWKTEYAAIMHCEKREQ